MVTMIGKQIAKAKPTIMVMIITFAFSSFAFCPVRFCCLLCSSYCQTTPRSSKARRVDLVGLVGSLGQPQPYQDQQAYQGRGAIITMTMEARVLKIPFFLHLDSQVGLLGLVG